MLCTRLLFAIFNRDKTPGRRLDHRCCYPFNDQRPPTQVGLSKGYGFFADFKHGKFEKIKRLYGSFVNERKRRKNKVRE